jgi:hypothetical protein
MRSSFGKHRPSDSPRGDTQRACSYCGVYWLRSKLRRDAAGLLACPDDQDGLDAVTLTEGNAALSGNRQLGNYIDESDGNIDPPNTDRYPGFVSPDGHKAPTW